MTILNPIGSVPDAHALACFPEAAAREHNWLPFYCERRKKVLHIACLRIPGPQLQSQIIEKVKNLVGSEEGWSIHWEHITDREGLTEAINNAYEGSYRLEEIALKFSELMTEASVSLDDDQWPIGRWFDALVNDAVHRRASDIHLLPNDESVSIRYRIDGQMHDRTDLPRAVWRVLLSRLKVLSALDVTEHRRPQEGAFERCVHGKPQPVRSAFMPHAKSEKVTLRLLSSVASLPTLSEIFVQDKQYQSIKRALHKRQGLIVVAGATGSGKTTTLYACMKHWLLQGLNLITLEDPIEVPLPGICQSEINSAIGYSFSAGLRAALRHDPDGLLVGEIRDSETCTLALRSAITGHPVMASVHANDAVGVFQRLLGLGATLTDLQQTVHTVIVQRLARTPCECRAEKSPCLNCSGTGFNGCVAAVEIFRPTAEFFNDPTQWISYQVPISTELRNSLHQLFCDGHINQIELNRLLDQIGGKDAAISNTSS